MIQYIEAAKRELKNIDYKNKYERMGTKYYAVTFTYTLDVTFDLLNTVPGIPKEFNGEAKAYLDPDTGKWTLDRIKLNDKGGYEFASRL